MKLVCVIPARLASSRFPQKVLKALGEKPLLQWVWEAAVGVDLFDDIAFAIDAPETAQLIDSFGGQYYMTSLDCASGTDRLIELQEKQLLSGDIWVNWQGDEPFIECQMIEDLLQSINQENIDIWTLKKKLQKPDEIENPNNVKVVTDSQGKALYFSRCPIPYDRDSQKNASYYKHIGIYAYRDTALKVIGSFAPSPLELAEKLEQLRFLENGLRIQVHETTYETLGIDTPEDLVRAEERIASQFAF